MTRYVPQVGHTRASRCCRAGAQWRCVLQVHMRTYECVQALSCTCGVAVRENNEVYILNMCTQSNGVRRYPTSAVRIAGFSTQRLGRVEVSTSGRQYVVHDINFIDVVTASHVGAAYQTYDVSYNGCFFSSCY